MSQSPVLAFDCFGTVFDMASVPREEIKAYVDHVRQPEWSPYTFPESWRRLTAHPDAAEGIDRLQRKNIECWAFSNGDRQLIGRASHANGIYWDHIVDLSIPKAYKPNDGAYQYLRSLTEGREVNIITANPKFGDLEGAELIRVSSHIIRHGKPETIIELADMMPEFEKQPRTPQVIRRFRKGSDAPERCGLTKVECDECFGVGNVFYAADHQFVKWKQAEPWKEYTCPICQGNRFLWIEPKKPKAT